MSSIGAFSLIVKFRQPSFQAIVSSRQTPWQLWGHNFGTLHLCKYGFCVAGLYHRYLSHSEVDRSTTCLGVFKGILMGKISYELKLTVTSALHLHHITWTFSFSRSLWTWLIRSWCRQSGSQKCFSRMPRREISSLWRCRTCSSGFIQMERFCTFSGELFALFNTVFTFNYPFVWL